MEKSSKATDDILEFIIVPYCPLDFLGVSKKWRTIATQYSVRDLRLTKTLVQNAIVSACRLGNLAMLKTFLAHRNASPTTNDLEALMTAIEYKKNELAKYILENYQVDPTRKRLQSKKHQIRFKRYDTPIEVAVGTHNTEMIQYFCANPAYVGTVLYHAIVTSQNNLAAEILDCKDAYHLQLGGDLLVAAMNNQQMFEKLLTYPEVPLNSVWSHIQSYHYNTSESWQFMLILEDPRFEMTDAAIKFCLGKCKDLDELKTILAKKGVNIHPTAELLDSAIQDDNLPFAQFLLQTPGWVKSTNYGFSNAAYRGRLDMVELLIAHGVKNENNCAEALSSLAYSGKNSEIIAKLMTLVTDFKIHDNVIQALDSKNDDVALVFLQHPKTDLATQDQLYLRRACENGLAKTVKFLLGQQKVNPTVQESVALRSAALNGHVEVVKFLLEDGRVDPAAKANHAIQCAALGDKIEIVEMLLADQRVNPSANNNYAYMKAKSQAIKDLLKKDERVASKLPK